MPIQSKNVIFIKTLQFLLTYFFLNLKNVYQSQKFIFFVRKYIAKFFMWNWHPKIRKNDNPKVINNFFFLIISKCKLWPLHEKNITCKKFNWFSANVILINNNHPKIIYYRRVIIFTHHSYLLRFFFFFSMSNNKYIKVWKYKSGDFKEKSFMIHIFWLCTKRSQLFWGIFYYFFADILVTKYLECICLDA